jgi:hypothetical protein
MGRGAAHDPLRDPRQLVPMVTVIEMVDDRIVSACSLGHHGVTTRVRMQVR